MAIKKTTKKAAKKVAAKKAPAKKALKKTSAKKAAVKKSPAKKTAAKKAPVKQSTPAKPASTQTSAPKATSTQPTPTKILANVDVGFGNTLYIRGEGAGLSWNKGTALDNVSPYEWSFQTNAAKGELTFKFLINDEVWAEGENLTVTAGGTSVSSPVFNW